MKRAVSISLGSSKRDKKVVVNFDGEEIQVERAGTDGDIAKVHKMYLVLVYKVREFQFLRKCMPKNLSGKIVVTNTTTENDIELVEQCGIKRFLSHLRRVMKAILLVPRVRAEAVCDKFIA